jgi:hypothetical protein
MAALDVNNLQIGTVLERNGGIEQGHPIPFWIIIHINRDADFNITLVHLRGYDPNNKTTSSLGVVKTLAQLSSDFSFFRQDGTAVGGKKRRSFKRKRTKRHRKSKKSKKSRKSRKY